MNGSSAWRPWFTGTLALLWLLLALRLYFVKQSPEMALMTLLLVFTNTYFTWRALRRGPT